MDGATRPQTPELSTVHILVCRDYYICIVGAIISAGVQEHNITECLYN